MAATPDVNLSAVSITLAGKEADVTSVSAFRAAPTLALVGGNWQVTGITLGEDSSLIKAGVTAQLAGGVANSTTSVLTITGREVLFTQPVTLAGSSVAALTLVNLTQNSDTITASNFAALGASGVAVGRAGVGAGLADGTVITAVNRDAQNLATSVTLSQAATATVAGQSLALLNVGTLTTSQFKTLGNNQIEVATAAVGLSVGMTRTGDGVPNGTKVTAINGNVVMLSQAVTGLAFSGAQPYGTVGRNQIQLSATDARLEGGAV